MSLLLVLLTCCSAPAADAVVVCPAAYRDALRPWVQHRQAQGHVLAFLSNEATTETIHQQIVAIAANGNLKYVLLVGDAVDREVDAQRRSLQTPTNYVPSRVNIHWGSEPEIATDNGFADLDDDGVPDLAVGRLPADDDRQLAAMVKKILTYERAANAGRWSQRINLIAGVGGFGYLADTVLEMATRKFLVDGIPPEFQTTMTYGSWQSPYCPDPRRFHDVTVRRLNEGCLFWVYIGHGARRHLDSIRVPGGAFPILDVDDAKQLRAAAGSPIALFLACYTAAFDGETDCLAEEMLRNPGGPVAVLGGSRVTMPYAMAVMANAMMDLTFRQRRETLGMVILEAKRRLAAENVADPNRQLLDAIAAAISPAKDQLREERIEHLALFNLIGDPMLHIRYPRRVEVNCAESAVAGQPLEMHATCPEAAGGVIELVCRRDRLKTPPENRPEFFPTEEFLGGLQRDYQAANDRVWTTLAVRCPAGESQIALPVPEAARGPCYARLLLQTDTGLAVGAAEVFIRPPRAETRD